MLVVRVTEWIPRDEKRSREPLKVSWGDVVRKLAGKKWTSLCAINCGPFLETFILQWEFKIDPWWMTFFYFCSQPIGKRHPRSDCRMGSCGCAQLLLVQTFGFARLSPVTVTQWYTAQLSMMACNQFLAVFGCANFSWKATLIHDLGVC